MAIGLKHGRRSNEENPQITWRKVDRFIEVLEKDGAFKQHHDFMVFHA